MSDFFREWLGDVPALAILRGMTIKEALTMVSHAAELGITLLEVPVQSLDSIPVFDAVLEAGTKYGMVIGTGTALTVEDVRIAHEHGARFTVSPGFDRDVAAESLRLGLPHLPGVSSPSEVHAAQRLGFTVQKFFPASVQGPGWIQAMAGPFPDIDFVATGGINNANCLAFLDAGALGVAFGSSIAAIQRLPKRGRR